MVKFTVKDVEIRHLKMLKMANYFCSWNTIRISQNLGSKGRTWYTKLATEIKSSIISKIWYWATVITLLKLNKPTNDQHSYRLMNSLQSLQKASCLAQTNNREDVTC